MMERDGVLVITDMSTHITLEVLDEKNWDGRESDSRTSCHMRRGNQNGPG